MFKWLDKICNKNQCTCWFDWNYGQCCKAHDDGYINNKQGLTKDQIDDAFYVCLKNNTNRLNAWLMYMAVKYSPIAKNYWKKYRK